MGSCISPEKDCGAILPCSGIAMVTFADPVDVFSVVYFGWVLRFSHTEYLVRYQFLASTLNDYCQCNLRASGYSDLAPG